MEAQRCGGADATSDQVQIVRSSLFVRVYLPLIIRQAQRRPCVFPGKRDRCDALCTQQFPCPCGILMNRCGLNRTKFVVFVGERSWNINPI